MTHLNADFYARAAERGEQWEQRSIVGCDRRTWRVAGLEGEAVTVN